MVERKQISRIRVVEVPPGGAPADIREEWVEMYLPLARTFAEIAEQYGIEGVSGDTEIVTQAGVLPADIETGLPSAKNAGGYVVNADEAIRLLEEKGTESSDKAAEYWKQALSEMYGDYRLAQLVFSRSGCEIVRNSSEDL